MAGLSNGPRLHADRRTSRTMFMRHIKQHGRTRAISRKHRGQGLTEYIIIVALIAVAAIAAVGLFGDSVKAQFTTMAAALVGSDNAALTTQQGVAAGAAVTKSDLGTYATAK